MSKGTPQPGEMNGLGLWKGSDNTSPLYGFCTIIGGRAYDVFSELPRARVVIAQVDPVIARKGDTNTKVL